MTAPDLPQGTRSEWITDKLLRGLITGVLRLPYERRVRFMGTAMRRIIGPITGYRKRAIANLAMIYPQMPDSEQRRVADAVCDNFGRTLIENYSWNDLGRRLQNTAITGEGLPHLKQAAAEGRPVIFVTGHFANHEVPRHMLTQLGYTIGGLYRPMSNQYFNAHYAKTMTAWGGPVFEQGRRGTAGFVRHLKSGGMATLLFDVASLQGQPMPFLGRQANTSMSAADLALKTGALILPYFATRQPDGLSFAATLQAPIAHSTSQKMMQDMTERLEAQIATHPEQWFWVHRRWKHAGQAV
jgi:KDO2-lipid IV(A) lauroyltransferase